MTVPSSYPWVNFKLQPTKSVDSTPLLVFGSDNTCVLNSILVCNTSQNDIFLNFYVLRVDDDDYFLKFNHPLSKYSSQDLLYMTNGFTLESGDILYSYSDYAKNTFDCLISYGQLLELG